MQSEQMIIVFIIGFVVGGIFVSHVLGSGLYSLMVLQDESDKIFKDALKFLDDAVKAKEKYR